jgi:acyl-CoA thioester hydrolase
VEIKISVASLKGVTLKLDYLMTKQDGQVVFEGHSEHCFLNKEGKIIRLAKEYPEFYAVLEEYIL